MCRSTTEYPPDGRRCPRSHGIGGYSNSRENQAARQQLSRARRGLLQAQAADDSAAAAAWEQKLTAAQQRVDASRDENAAPATESAAVVAPRAAAADPEAATLWPTTSGTLTPPPAAAAADTASDDPDAALQRILTNGVSANTPQVDLEAARRAPGITRKVGQAIVSEHFRREQAAQVASSPAPMSGRGSGPETVSEAIRAAYAAGAKTARDDLQHLTEVRARIDPRFSREEVDQALLELGKSQVAYLAPNPNRKDVTAEDHAAAVWIGGDENDMIAFYD